jgi:hypothetical protein
MRRVAGVIGLALLTLVVLGMTLWAALAICYSDLSTGSPRTIRAAVYAMAAVAALLFIRRRRYAFAAVILMFSIVLIWFFSLKPLADREWSLDVARMPTIRIDGDRMIVSNLRNFDYRSETDFTQNWEERTYDLSKLRSVDFMLVYWGSKSIAHGMVSFVFEGDEALAVSIETRKEKRESYSALQGFFRQYELTYVFADERDVVGVRVNHRNEDVYLYRTNLTAAQARVILLSYVHRTNSLAQQPEFYNALTSNCVTNVVYTMREVNPKARMTWETIFSGHAARQAYNNGRLDTRIPFEELEARSRINPAVTQAGNASDFSARIRVGLPDPLR